MTFTVDWFSPHIPIWEEKVLPKLRIMPHVNYLEIGSHEGRSLLWIRGQHSDLHATSIDPHLEGSWDNFILNIDTDTRIIRDTSANALPELLENKFSYHAIYIDGSHWAHDVLFDTVMSWRLLKSGGIMIWDDYGWLVDDDPIKGPKPAIDAFLTCYRTQYKVVHIGYQFMVEKL